MVVAELDVRQGTLDLLVLKTLSWGPMHGYTIMSRLRHATDSELRLEDAALYPALHRLEARDLIESEWGLSDNNRRAKFYRLTAAGRRALQTETAQWNRYVSLVAKVLRA
ncbi:MAG TPA: PadR family transcriptional regulator [Gemmatimonadales bacterium]